MRVRGAVDIVVGSAFVSVPGLELKRMVVVSASPRTAWKVSSRLIARRKQRRMTRGVWYFFGLGIWSCEVVADVTEVPGKVVQ